MEMEIGEKSRTTAEEGHTVKIHGEDRAIEVATGLQIANHVADNATEV